MQHRQATTMQVAYALLSLMVFAMLVWRIYLPGPDGLDQIGYQLGRDFINIWAGPQIAASGKLAVLFDQQTYWAEIVRVFGRQIPYHAWSYPPTSLVLFRPLGMLPYYPALALWTFGMFAVFAALVLSQVAPRHRLAAGLVLALSPAALINTITGQNGFLTAALLIGAFLVIERRPVLAGILIGLLTLKPHLGLIVPFVLIGMGAWRTIAAAAVTALALVLASLALYGIEAWQGYLPYASALHRAVLIEFKGGSSLMMTSVLAGARMLGIPFGLACIIQAVVAAVVLPVAVIAAVRAADPARRLFVLITGTLLVTPYAFDYDWPALAAVIVWVLFGRLEFREPWRYAYLAAWIAPTLGIPIGLSHVPIAPPALAAVFVLAVREALAGEPLLTREMLARAVRHFPASLRARLPVATA